MSILRLFIDSTYYQNRIFCVCVCHNELNYELLGRICDGCRGRNGRTPGKDVFLTKKVCEVFRNVYTIPTIVHISHTISTGGVQ